MAKPGPITAKPLSVLLSDVFSEAYARQGFAARELVTRWREIAAFDEPLLASGQRVIASRAKLIADLQPEAEDAHRAISGARENLRLEYAPGAVGDFAEALAAAKSRLKTYNLELATPEDAHA